MLEVPSQPMPPIASNVSISHFFEVGKPEHVLPCDSLLCVFDVFIEIEDEREMKVKQGVKAFLHRGPKQFRGSIHSCGTT